MSRENEMFNRGRASHVGEAGHMADFSSMMLRVGGRVGAGDVNLRGAVERGNSAFFADKTALLLQTRSW